MKAIRVIRDEHRALAAVLKAMEFTVAGVRDGRFPADLRLFAMLVDYIVRVPEESHHPKEDEVLFPIVRATVDAAFAADADPWRGRDGEFVDLFSAIVDATPAPMGLGASPAPR